MSTYHILNGDCLNEQLPAAISGERIIARLCLVDGPVVAATDETLFKLRATFISENYPGFSEKDYRNKTVSELQRIKHLPENATINLWFEDDLFCQVNFWFVLHLIAQNNKKYTLNLVRPKIHSEYAFGRMSQVELMQAFDNKVVIMKKEQVVLGKFWKLYQKNDLLQMLDLAKRVQLQFPFLLPATKAQQDRLSEPRRSKTAILRIIQELDTREFGPVFKVFCQQEKIYGFGDLQVRRLFDEVIKDLEAKA